MSARVATTLSPFKPNHESLHWARWEKDSSEFSSSFLAHPTRQRNTPQHSSMVRNLRRTDLDPKLRVDAYPHRDFQPHPHQLDQVQVVNTRDSAMSHLDPSKTFTNVTNLDEVYRSEKDTKFGPTSCSHTVPIHLPPSLIFPTCEFYDQTTSRDYHAYDLSQASTRAIVRGREGSTRIGGEFEGVSSSQHDYPPHIAQPVRGTAMQPDPVSLGSGPLIDATVHRQFFIPHTPAPTPPIVPPGYKKEQLCFEEDTSYNTFFRGHRSVSRAPRYEPINGKLFSSLQPDMQTQTSLHFPPKSAKAYFAPVPLTYRPPDGALDGNTSQRIDFTGCRGSLPAASAKPTHRPLTGDFFSSRTHTDTFIPLPLNKRPPPAVDKHGIALPQDSFLAESTTKSAYIGSTSLPPKPVIPVLANHRYTDPLEHSSIYKSSYNS
ncbi:hypothetical protein LOD99_11894 [Oopsacas minuta]|uniref:Uncharacterized protein n=1 Tax=Oopsacas minuta TaxID=111878 RepID=A0AAV7JHM2_9METZ|nr:hypothetical protein LOD99_11894 [Oopsacas minuta]